MNPLLLVLLAGQSNMAGRGEIAEEDREEIPGLFTFDRECRWVPAVDPIGFDRKFAGVSIGRTFGKLLLAANPGCRVGLVPTAIGGTPISAWKPGGASPFEGDPHPYDDSIRRARLAAKDGVWKAVLWHQGETDCKPENTGYADDLREVVVNFRRDLAIPEVLFLCGELGHFLERESGAITAATRQIVAELPHMGWVSAEGLTDKGDKLHFDAAATREFGRRYWNVYNDHC